MTRIDRDRALGAVLGALVGDAAGAVLEFFGREIEETDVAHAMTLPGGGTWEVAPGQVTDDGELTMSLLHALADKPDDPTAAAAKRYAAWVASDPFDIGATTAASLGCLRDPAWRLRAENDGVHAAMTEAARERCMRSKANGSLMRATPLAVWGATRDEDRVRLAVEADVRLSHPNPSCVAAAVAYVLAIRHLVTTNGDAGGAIAVANTAAGAESEVAEWLQNALAGEPVPYSPQDGFVKIGFSHAFRHLAAGTSYEAALRETLLGGGDTDTNACIVGGLLGARFGAAAIPANMREGVLGADLSRGKNPRPRELHPRDVPLLVDTLLCL